jgi:hypothetical protein
MNRHVVVNTVLGCIFGAALAVVGFAWYTWQYWLLFAIFVAAIVNSLIPTRR